MSISQYRIIDLIILAAVTFIFETLATTAATTWFPGQLYTVSPTLTVVCIVMMRWNGFAAIHAAVGGMIFAIASGGTQQQILIYCVGNCFALLALLLFKFIGKEKIREKFYLTMLFTFTAYVGAQVGRWIIAMIFGSPAEILITFLTTDCISLLFMLVVTLIARKVDGLFEDQKHYLIRQEKERKRQEAEDYYNL